jgi:hypothetical protein
MQFLKLSDAVLDEEEKQQLDTLDITCKLLFLNVIRPESKFTYEKETIVSKHNPHNNTQYVSLTKLYCISDAIAYSNEPLIGCKLYDYSDVLVSIPDEVKTDNGFAYYFRITTDGKNLSLPGYHKFKHDFFNYPRVQCIGNTPFTLEYNNLSPSNIRDY